MKKSALIICLLAFGIAIAQPPAQLYTQKEVKATTRDSLVLCSTSFSAPGKTASTFVCLPMMGHTTDSYFTLKDSLAAISQRIDSVHFTLPSWRIFDLRGHGCSIRRGKSTLNYETMPDSEFAKYPTDIADALRGTTDLTIIGASIGANTAALLTLEMPNLKRLILLSPGLSYKGVEPADAIMTFKGEVLLVASSGDEYSYNSAREMASLNPDHCTLMIFDGDAHGTDIINDNPAAMRALIDWILKK